jgi:phosphatidylglycerophosphate synthase
MLDRKLRPLIDPPLNAVGRWLAARGVAADHVTVAACLLGLAGAGAIALGSPLFGLAFLLAGRLCDGLDGAVARATKRTDRGAFLDITLDFWVYAAVPTAFAILDPARNGVAAALLLSSFLANGAAFLAFAALAGKRGISTDAQGLKSIYYLGGLVEGTETIAFFALFCLFPDAFPWLAGAMALLCWISAAARVVAASRLLTD